MALSNKIVLCQGIDGKCLKAISVEDIKPFIQEVLKEMDHLNEKFESIAMRANIETMVGDVLLGENDE